MLLEKQKKGPLQPNLCPALHALDISSGAEKFGGPVAPFRLRPGTGNGASGGVLNFDPKWQLNRAGLLLQTGLYTSLLALTATMAPGTVGFSPTMLRL